MHMQNSSKAREWLDRGHLQVNPIDAFTDFWRGFNSLFFTAATGDERNKIKAFISQITEATADLTLQNHPAQVNYLLSQPVIDMRGNGRDTASNITGFNSATSKLIKLQELFMIIYQIRCNLEHGQKSLHTARDIQLCECAAPLVADIVNQTT
jgi:hypothetical protein